MMSDSCRSGRTRSRDDRRARPASAPAATSCRRRCCATSASAATRWSRDRGRRRRSRCSSRDRRRGSSRRSGPAASAAGGRVALPPELACAAAAPRARTDAVRTEPAAPAADRTHAAPAGAAPAATPRPPPVGTDRPIRVQLAPRVVRSEEAALAALRRDQRVDRVRILPVDADPDPADLDRRQPLGQLRPLRAAVGRLVEPALGTAADQLSDRAAPLIRRGVEDVGVLRIHRDVGDAGVGADRQHRLPRLAAVGRLVEAAVAAGAPQRADGADVDDVGVARIDEDVLDVLGVLEPHARPRLAGIGRLVDAVAEADAALVVVLARAEPDDVGVLRIDDHRAERIRAVGLEDRRPGVAAVLRLPEVAGARRDVPDVRVLGVDGDVGERPVVRLGPMLRNAKFLERLGRQRGRRPAPNAVAAMPDRAHPGPDPSHLHSLRSIKTATTPTRAHYRRNAYGTVRVAPRCACSH